ncbi:pescadillo [Tanacetum coccineum]
MVKWIMLCVSTPSYSLCINGERHGFFKGGRGLRQGDPMSPYLFTIVMEVFNLIMKQKIKEDNSFKYHHGCKSLKISHLCFADDLLVICHGDVNSIKVINRALDTFSDVSSLHPNLKYQDTVGSKGKKVINALSFYKMETNEISKRYIVPCFMNGLEAYDGEINLAFDDNLISNEFAGELYFMKFIINPEEDDFEPGVILGRSFLRLAKGVVDFDSGVITIYPEPDPFEDDFEKTGKSSDDWDQLLDFNFDDVLKFGEELPPFVCKMGKRNHNKKRAMKNLNLFYQDIGSSSSAEGHLTQEEVAKEALAIRISQKYALLEEELPVIETMAYNDKYKKILDEIWKDKEKDDLGAFIFPIRLEGKVNENALADTWSDINTMPYRINETLGREEMKKIDRGITMINHTQVEAMGKLSNVLCQVGVTTIIAKFLILDIPIDRDAPIVVGRGFLYTMGSILNTPKRLFSTFDGVCHQTCRAARFDVLRTAESDGDDEEEYVIKRNKFGAPIWPETCFISKLYQSGRSIMSYTDMPLKQVNWKPDYKGSYTKEEEATGQWRTKIRLQEHTMTRPVHHDPNAQDMKLWKRYCFHKFTMSSCFGKDVTEMQSLEIDDMLRIWVHEAESNEEIFSSFDEVCVDDELQTKKIIKFRLGGRAHSLTLLEFARRLGLYQAVELEEDGFNVYFEGGLRNDDNFNAHNYWLSISRKDNLSLSRSHTSTIRRPILRVIHKMITYGLCQRTTGLGDCKMDEEERSWDSERESNLLWDLDSTTLRDLINSDGKLISEDPQPGAYNPLGYARPKYDQYYQQYQPPPPQYQQQHNDDE